MTTIASIIDRFGGVRAMARKVNVVPNTVQNWKRIGRLPVARIDEVRAAAEAHGVEVTPQELAAAALNGTGVAA